MKNITTGATTSQLIREMAFDECSALVKVREAVAIKSREEVEDDVIGQGRRIALE